MRSTANIKRFQLTAAEAAKLISHAKTVQIPSLRAIQYTNMLIPRHEKDINVV